MQKQCSIIIPAYNSEKTICNCVDKAINEANADFDFEIIIIDDGSIDDTLQVLNKYKGIPLITVIHKENGGVSSARNKGMEIAKGKYLYFPDADDTFDIKVLQLIVSVLEETNIEMGIADYRTIDSRNGSIQEVVCDIPYNEVFSQDYVGNIFYQMAFTNKQGLSNVWNKIFLAQIIIDNNISFDDNSTHGEDWDFCLQFYQKMQSFIHVKYILYNYTVDGSQSWTKYSRQLGYSLLKGHKTMKDILTRYNLLNQESTLTFETNFLHQIYSYITMDKITKTQIKEFIKSKITQDNLSIFLRLDKSQLLSLGLSRRDKIIALFLKLRFYNISIRLIKKWR